MTIPRSRRVVPASLLGASVLGLALVGVALAGCGGAGSGGGGGVVVPPAAARPRLVVKPTSEVELIALCEPKGAEVLGEIPGTGYCAVECPKDVPAVDFLDELLLASCVVDAAEDAELGFPEGGGGTIPLFGDDPFEAIATQPAIEVIGALVAHGRGFRGEGLVVAVIDTGVAADHPAIAGRLAGPGYDFVGEDADPSDAGNGLDDNGDGRVDEGVGHGTFVASLILAVAPDATILPLRALDSDALGTASSVARAIAYAVEQGAHVINLSAGLVSHLSMIQEAVDSARAEGVLVIAAAGNRASPTIDFPAAVQDAVAVASVDGEDLIAPFTSYGQKVDLAAPGVNVLGAHPLSPSGTATWSGTSFSTALVTGSYALLRAADLDADPADLIACLKGASFDIYEKNPLFKDLLGEGRIDLDVATASH